MSTRRTVLLLLGAVACATSVVGPPGSITPITVFGGVNAYGPTLPAPLGAMAFAPGDSVRGYLVVHAVFPIRWVGVGATGGLNFRDSLRITGQGLDTSVSVQWAFQPPPGFVGTLTIHGFARDSVPGSTGPGDLADTTLYGGLISVYRVVTYPYAYTHLDSQCSFIIPQAAPLNGCDMAIDPVRDVAYFTEPDSLRISVLSLGTLLYGTPIVTPDTATGVDVTTSGDSLVVMLPVIRQLGVVNLTTAPPTWHLDSLRLDTIAGRRPYRVALAATNRAIIGLTIHNYSKYDPIELLELDLHTGAERAHLRTPATAATELWPVTHINRSRDGSHILLDMTSGYQMYLAAQDTLLPPGLASVAGPGTSLTAAGQRFLVGATLFEGTSEITSLSPPGGGIVSVLTPGGDSAYFGFAGGFLRTRLADGITLEKVALPEDAQALDLIPGGTRVLVRGATHVYAVDLGAAATPTTPPAASSATPVRWRGSTDGAQRPYEGARR